MKLFSFPHVVIGEVMEQSEPAELINLSLCSKNAHSLVKTFSKVNETLEIEDKPFDGYILQLSEKQEVLMRAVSKKTINIRQFDLRTSPYFKYFMGDDDVTHTYWKDDARGCQETVNYVCDLLKIPVTGILIPRKESLWMVDFAQRRQEEKLKIVAVHEEFPISAEDYTKILSCNVTESMICAPRPPLTYQFDGKLPPVKHLNISCGFWITREHLLGLESQTVHIFESQLKSSDLNEVVRCWLNGGLTNSKYLSIDVTRMEFAQDIRDRLEPVQKDLYYAWSHFGDLFEFVSSESFHIRRKDNTVATLLIDPQFITMAVWPDLNDKHFE